MAYASRSGRAKTSARSPRAFAVCDRCSQWVNHVSLSNQHDWRGTALLPLNIYVCERCRDIPQEQLRAIVIPADPLPIMNPRVEPFLYDEFTPSLSFNDTTGPNGGNRNSMYLMIIMP